MIEFKKHIHYSDELEFAILGACMIEKEAFGRTYGILEKDFFYIDNNQIIYQALAEMYNSGLPIDMLTVCDYIVNQFKKELLGSYEVAYYITKVTYAVVSSAHLEYHAYIIRRMWMERELIKLTTVGIENIDGDVNKKIIHLSQSIQKIKEGEYKEEWADMTELAYRLMVHQDEMAKTGGIGLTTGVPVLDRENGGFFGGQLIVIGARPSVGKSAFMGQLAIEIAKSKVTVGIISLEMSNNEIAARLSALGTDEDFRTIFRNLYADQNQRERWYQRMGKLIDLPIYVSDRTKVSAIDIKAKAAKLKHKHGLGCLMIDYLQLVDSENNGKFRNRENEVSEISRSCKLMAKELNVPVIILCQLNRESLKRKGEDRYPQLSDLRESGSIEQDADVVMFLHRDYLLGGQYQTDENGQSTEDKANLIVRKWRNGSSNAIIDMQFDGPRMQFRLGSGLHVGRIAPATEAEDEEIPF